MTGRVLKGIVLLVVAQGLAGCSSSPSVSAPLTPSAIPGASAQVSSIAGFVLDTGFRPQPGARVEVVDGPQAGTSTVADASGQFSLTGTFDSTTRFRATKEGHVTATQAWSCSVSACPGTTRAQPWLGFYLDVLAAPVNIAGDYTVTFIADSACADLPDELRTRTYAATITPSNLNTPSNTNFNVTVAGAPFLGNLNTFVVGVAGDYLGFWLHGGHDPPIVEQLAANTYLAFSGNAAAIVGSAAPTISASFEGWVDYCVAQSPMGSTYNCGTSNVTGDPIPGAVITRAHCESNNHRLILTRR